MKKKGLVKSILTIALATAVIGAGFAGFDMKGDSAYAASVKPKIEKTDYEGKGKVDVEFYGKVKYHNAKVKVKKLSSGKSYKADILSRDSDDIEFLSPSYAAGHKYKYTISGIKKYGAKSYTSVSGYFKVPKKTEIMIEEIEYDGSDRELSVDFKTKVSYKKPKVEIYTPSGEFVCSGTILERENDSIEVLLDKRLTYADWYVCSILGIKAKTAKEYKTININFTAIDR